MKAIQLEKPKQFRTLDVPEPPSPKPGDVVVRIHRVARGMVGHQRSRKPAR